MVRTCGENLPPAVLRGHVDPLNLILPGGEQANSPALRRIFIRIHQSRASRICWRKGRTWKSYNAYRAEKFGEFSSSETAPRGMTSCTKSYDHSIPYEDTRAAHRNRTHLRAFIPCIRGQKQLAVPLTGSAPAIVHHLGSQPELLRFCLLLPDCAARPHPIDHLVMTITAGFGGWGLWCGDIGKGHRPESRLHHG